MKSVSSLVTAACASSYVLDSAVAPVIASVTLSQLAINKPKATTIAPIPVAVNAAANALAPAAAAVSPIPTAINDLDKNVLRVVYTFVIPVKSIKPFEISVTSFPNSTKDDCKLDIFNPLNCFNVVIKPLACPPIAPIGPGN